jgi:hypothetical protein
MEPGTSTDIEPVVVEPVIEERGTGDGVLDVPFTRGPRRDDGGEQEFTDPETNIIRGTD